MNAVRTLAVLAALVPVGLAPAAALDAAALYGDRMEFEIRRNGEKIGTHSVRFEADAAGLRAEAASDLKVSFLGIAFYRMRYRSVSLWQDGRLQRLQARTEENGKVQEVSARGEAGGLLIEGQGIAVTAPGDLLTTDHFHPGVIGTGAVLNTITGRLNRVQMLAEARETVETGDAAPRPATRYAYRGELEATVWYDEAGRWVGLEFKGRDGSIIRYVCRRCG